MPVEIDIAHVAKLARLELTDDETARLRSQLGQILEHAARVGEVAAADVRADRLADPSGQRATARTCPSRRCRSRRHCVTLPSATATVSACRGSRRRARERRALRPLRCASSPPSSPRARPRRAPSSPPRRRGSRPSTDETRRVPDADGAAGAERAEELDVYLSTGAPQSPVAGIPVALKDVLTTNGDPDDMRLEDPRDATFPRTTPPPGRVSPVPAPCSSARPTATSSRWARRTRTPRTGPCTTPGISTACPAARAAARPRPWRPARRSGPSAPTPGAACGSRRRSAASSGSSLRTGASVATG